MSQVSEAYQNLSRSLQTGMKGLGEAHISGAKMKLLEAQQEAELTDPRRVLEQEEARIKIQKMSMPYNINTAMGGEDINAFENLIALADKSNPNVSVVDILPFNRGYTEIRVTNEKHELNPEGSAKYYKPGTNEFFTLGHLEANQDEFNKIIFANFNRFNHYRAVIENSPEESDEYKDANEFLNNPARQVTELAQDAENMRMVGLEGAANGAYDRIGVIQKNMQLEISGREKTERLYPTEKGLLPRAEAKALKPFTAPSKEGPTKGKTEERMLAKDLAAAEQFILEEPEEETSRPYVDFFNEMAERPYMYIWGPIAKKLWRDTEGTTRIDLPKYKGKQVYARDVYEKAGGNPEVMMEILKQLGAI